jgi:hypothetical protein
MLHATPPKASQKRPVRFRGICADAKALKVNRVTLYRVLTGKWQSRSLLARYHQLKNAKK